MKKIKAIILIFLLLLTTNTLSAKAEDTERLNYIDVNWGNKNIKKGESRTLKCTRHYFTKIVVSKEALEHQTPPSEPCTIDSETGNCYSGDKTLDGGCEFILVGYNDKVNISNNGVLKNNSLSSGTFTVVASYVTKYGNKETTNNTYYAYENSNDKNYANTKFYYHYYSPIKIAEERPVWSITNNRYIMQIVPSNTNLIVKKIKDTTCSDNICKHSWSIKGLKKGSTIIKICGNEDTDTGTKATCYDQNIIIENNNNNSNSNSKPSSSTCKRNFSWDITYK